MEIQEKLLLNWKRKIDENEEYREIAGDYCIHICIEIKGSEWSWCHYHWYTVLDPMEIYNFDDFIDDVNEYQMSLDDIL